MKYSALLEELYALSDSEFALFQQKIINPRAQKIIGVRTPALRQLVKKYKNEYRALLSFPDEYYEVTFLKLNTVALLPYGELLSVLKPCVAAIENWALCDTFKAKAIAANKDDFLPHLKQFLTKEEFSQRYTLVTLLNFYVEEKYLPVIFSCLKSINSNLYYAHMGAAWLLAEVLVKHFDKGVAFLKQNALDKRTHNKAIQKARESFRLSPEKKAQLHALKRK